MILINGLLKQKKNDMGRMKDSHYWEQADVFFAYRTAGFHQTLLITVCTLVFLQFSPLTFIWSIRFCIKYIVIALLLPSLGKCMPVCRVNRQLNKRGVCFLFQCRRKKEIKTEIPTPPPQQLRRRPKALLAIFKKKQKNNILIKESVARYCWKIVWLKTGSNTKTELEG